MAKAKPKAFFPNKYMAVIGHKKVDVWAERMKDLHPYFSTWEDAHDWQMNQAYNAVEAAKKEEASARRHLAKVEKMTVPNVK